MASVTPASQLAIRPTPEMAPTGIPALDALTGGLPRGCLTEICGPVSSGRTTILLAALAAATRRGEYCAVIDASDSLDPHSVAAAGVELDRLLWVRCHENSPQSHRDTEKSNPKKKGNEKSDDGCGCPISGTSFAPEACPELAERVGISSQAAFNFAHNKKDKSSENTSRQFEQRLEQVLRATDLLLESGGFGLIILDLANIPPQSARRIPLTTWFRFRRAVEHKLTILLAIEQHPIAGSCSSLLLQLGSLAHDRDSMKTGASDKAAAKRRKNAAHGASRGLSIVDDDAPERRKKIPGGILTEFDCNLNYPKHANLLCGLKIHAELIRSRLDRDRKPASSVAFETKTAWAG